MKFYVRNKCVRTQCFINFMKSEELFACIFVVGAIKLIFFKIMFVYLTKNSYMLCEYTMHAYHCLPTPAQIPVCYRSGQNGVDILNDRWTRKEHVMT